MVTVEGDAQTQIYVGSNLPKPFWWQGPKYSRIVAVAPPSFHFDCKSLHLLPFCFEFEFTRWHVRTQLDSWINLTLPLSIRHTTTTRWASIKYWESNTRSICILITKYKVPELYWILQNKHNFPLSLKTGAARTFPPQIRCTFPETCNLPSFASFAFFLLQTHLSPSLSFSWSH